MLSESFFVGSFLGRFLYVSVRKTKIILKFERFMWRFDLLTIYGLIRASPFVSLEQWGSKYSIHLHAQLGSVNYHF